MQSEATQTLFKVQNALLRANISDLVDKEQEIRSKNEQMDGLIEAEQDDGQLFGVDRLTDSLRRNATSPENLLENVENDARFFAGKSAFEDDICLLAVRWLAR